MIPACVIQGDRGVLLVAELPGHKGDVGVKNIQSIRLNNKGHTKGTWIRITIAPAV